MFKDLHAWASEDATRRADGWIVQDVRLSFGAGKVLVRRVAELVEVGLDVVRHPARLLDFVVPSRLLDRSLLDSSVPLDALIQATFRKVSYSDLDLYMSHFGHRHRRVFWMRDLPSPRRGRHALDFQTIIKCNTNVKKDNYGE